VIDHGVEHRPWDLAGGVERDGGLAAGGEGDEAGPFKSAVKHGAVVNAGEADEHVDDLHDDDEIRVPHLGEIAEAAGAEVGVGAGDHGVEDDAAEDAKGVQAHAGSDHDAVVLGVRPIVREERGEVPEQSVSNEGCVTPQCTVHRAPGECGDVSVWRCYGVSGKTR
jgi:hypothetical protein